MGGKNTTVGLAGGMNQIEIKGLEGEQKVSKQLRELGYFVLNRGQHRKPIDLMVSKEGKEFGIQVKYKNPRIYYPDTGFEKWRYEMYKKAVSRLEGELIPKPFPSIKSLVELIVR